MTLSFCSNVSWRLYAATTSITNTEPVPRGCGSGSRSSYAQRLTMPIRSPKSSREMIARGRTRLTFDRECEVTRRNASPGCRTPGRSTARCSSIDDGRHILGFAALDFDSSEPEECSFGSWIRERNRRQGYGTALANARHSRSLATTVISESAPACREHNEPALSYLSSIGATGPADAAPGTQFRVARLPARATHRRRPRLRTSTAYARGRASATGTAFTHLEPTPLPGLLGLVGGVLRTSWKVPIEFLQPTRRRVHRRTRSSSLQPLLDDPRQARRGRCLPPVTTWVHLTYSARGLPASDRRASGHRSSPFMSMLRRGCIRRVEPFPVRTSPGISVSEDGQIYVGVDDGGNYRELRRQIRLGVPVHLAEDEGRPAENTAEWRRLSYRGCRSRASPAGPADRART